MDDNKIFQDEARGRYEQRFDADDDVNNENLSDQKMELWLSDHGSKYSDLCGHYVEYNFGQDALEQFFNNQL